LYSLLTFLSILYLFVHFFLFFTLVDLDALNAAPDDDSMTEYPLCSTPKPDKGLQPPFTQIPRPDISIIEHETEIENILTGLDEGFLMSDSQLDHGFFGQPSTILADVQPQLPINIADELPQSSPTISTPNNKSIPCITPINIDRIRKEKRMAVRSSLRCEVVHARLLKRNAEKYNERIRKFSKYDWVFHDNDRIVNIEQSSTNNYKKRSEISIKTSLLLAMARSIERKLREKK
jgi:hypothetical protein